MAKRIVTVPSFTITVDIEEPLPAPPVVDPPIVVPPVIVAPPTGTHHAYFEALIARPDLFAVDGIPRAYSLRPRTGAPKSSPYWEGQLLTEREGGYVTGAKGRPVLVTYQPSADTDPHAQDAAKVVIAPYILRRTTLTADLAADDPWVPVDPADGVLGQARRTIRVGTELMTMIKPPDGSPIGRVEPGARSASAVHVTRGTFGTVATSHAAGTPVDHANNSLQNQVRVPIHTPGDVNAMYFATWDGYWTDSYLGSGLDGHKTFQFAAGGDRSKGQIWLEPRTLYNGGSKVARHPNFDPTKHVAVADVRAYNRPGGGADWTTTDGNMLGPGATRDPLQPMANRFLVHPNRWTRWFVLFEVRVNDYDYFTLWVADEQTAPVKIIDNLPVSIPLGSAPNSIKKWWIELNTSQNERTRLDDVALVTYFRNFVMLQNPVDLPLLRP